MLKETARVVAIEPDCIWVETNNQSVCGRCAAEKGCGQRLLARWVARNGYLKIPLNGNETMPLGINDRVDIGIPEDVVVKSAIVIYLLPLVLLIVGAIMGSELFFTDWAAILCGLAGFVLGGTGVVLYSRSVKFNRHYQPVLLRTLVTHQ